MKLVWIAFIFLLTATRLNSQVYTEKQTRHRFAQMNIGLDWQSNIGGATEYFNEQMVMQSLNFNQIYKPRVIIGGTHFWGHADFYIAIPLFSPSFEKHNQVIQYSTSVETVFKYYPWRIEHNKLRPYAGISLAPFYYRQSNNNVMYGEGPDRVHTSAPFIGGLTFDTHRHLFEANVLWNFTNKQEYYISRTDRTEVTTPPIYVSLSYKYMFETTWSAEDDWESGSTAKMTEALAQQNKLNGFFLGVGLSSSFWQGSSTYNEILRPYIMDYPISIMPDFGIGYYWHRSDLNIVSSYRSYGTETSAYGADQTLRRKSLGLEVTKFLFDYHGFVPFVGPLVSWENLSFEENFEGQPTRDVTEHKLGYGLAFGWDIRPNRIQSWLLRTNIRWFPNLKLQVEGDAGISFDNLEFNFIQLVVFPGRMF